MSSKECDIINHFNRSVSLPTGVVGIGDDCAVIDLGGGKSQVITTDTMTEGTHFIFEAISPKQLAYKAIASNLSDVISMGATPKYLFLALTFSQKCSDDWIAEFSSEFNKICTKFNVFLIGGDTTKSSSSVTITITAIGECDTPFLKFRSSALVGDYICVLNPLGGSSCGLHLLLQGVNHQPLVELHYKPKLFIEESIWLAKQSGVGAMMDISDGIAKDLNHILTASSVGAFVNLNAIPIPSEVLTVCSSFGLDPYSFALEGGEEYAPLFTMSPSAFDALSASYFSIFGSKIYKIGEITPSGKDIQWVKDGVVLENVSFSGFQH